MSCYGGSGGTVCDVQVDIDKETVLDWYALKVNEVAWSATICAPPPPHCLNAYMMRVREVFLMHGSIGGVVLATVSVSVMKDNRYSLSPMVYLHI